MKKTELNNLKKFAKKVGKFTPKEQTKKSNKTPSKKSINKVWKYDIKKQTINEVE